MRLSIRAGKSLQSCVISTGRSKLAIWAILLNFTAGVGYVFAGRVERWDKSLPEQTFHRIDIHAENLARAWQRIGTALLLRSNLADDKPLTHSASFDFQAVECKGREILDALVATYTDMAWDQDLATGVIWVHPKSVNLDELLSQTVRMPVDEVGIPMLTGVLQALTDVEKLRLGAQVGSDGYVNTFNGPVALPSGLHSVQEILNLCCHANPNTSYYVALDVVHRTVIFPNNLSAVRAAGQPDGATAMWNLAIGRMAEDPPSEDEIRRGLGNPNPDVRWAARAYAYVMIMSWNIEKWLPKAENTAALIWTALAIGELRVRIERTISPDAAAALQRALADNDAKIEPKLRLLAGLEYARLSGDMSYVDASLAADVSPADLTEIMPEIFRICRQAPKLREALRTKDLHRLAQVDPRFGTLADLQPRIQLVEPP